MATHLTRVPPAGLPAFVLVGLVAAALAGCEGKTFLADLPTAPPAPPSGPTEILVAGTVLDATFRPLAGARIEVLDGPQAGPSATVGANGEFYIRGAFDETTRFQATRDGHVAATRPFPERCAACNPNHWVHFILESLAPQPDITGEYTMTFVADGQCVDRLPPEARSRTFDASVKPYTLIPPANSWFALNLTSSGVIDHPNGPRAGSVVGLAGNYVNIGFGDGHGAAGVVEEIGPNTYVTLEGELKTFITDTSTISGAFAGAVYRCELPAAWGSRYSCSAGGAITSTGCQSDNHQLILRRR